jgi:hypothetical protein
MKIIDLSKEVKHPVKVPGGWMIVERGRVTPVHDKDRENMRRIIKVSARENRISVAEVHAAIIAYAMEFGEPENCAQAIAWWRQTKFRRAA